MYHVIEPEKSALIPYYSHYLSEEQMKKYLEYFQKDLPTAFRVNRHNRSEEYQEIASSLLHQYFYERLPDKTLMQDLPCVKSG